MWYVAWLYIIIIIIYYYILTTIALEGSDHQMFSKNLNYFGHVCITELVLFWSENVLITVNDH